MSITTAAAQNLIAESALKDQIIAEVNKLTYRGMGYPLGRHGSNSNEEAAVEALTAIDDPKIVLELFKQIIAIASEKKNVACLVVNLVEKIIETKNKDIIFQATKCMFSLTEKMQTWEYCQSGQSRTAYVRALATLQDAEALEHCPPALNDLLVKIEFVEKMRTSGLFYDESAKAYLQELAKLYHSTPNKRLLEQRYKTTIHALQEYLVLNQPHNSTVSRSLILQTNAMLHNQITFLCEGDEAAYELEFIYRTVKENQRDQCNLRRHKAVIRASAKLALQVAQPEESKNIHEISSQKPVSPLLMSQASATNPKTSDAQSTHSLQPVFILIGPPGSGKSAISKGLSSELFLAHISMGDLFREHLCLNTEMGQEAKPYMDKSELAPDTLALKMLSKEIVKLNTVNGYILDGFPRTLRQAQELEKMLAGKAKIYAMHLPISDEISIDRVLNRHRGCSTKRADDTLVITKKKLAIYNQESPSVIDYYRQSGRLITAQPKPNNVAKVFQSVMDAYKTMHDTASQQSAVRKYSL